MTGLCLSYRYLRWTNDPSSEPAPALPTGVERHFIPTPSGDLEILYAAPSASCATHGESPLFFVHGGMGSAWVWLEYMTYLSSRGIPCYAISLRGHGRSWAPGYLRMVFFTTRTMLESDVLAGIAWATKREGRDVVLVGHSSGGGLSQAILGQKKATVSGLALVAAVPAFGSSEVYADWSRLDPWSSLRILFHFWHPNSMLSHPALVRRAFFSPRVSEPFVENFLAHSAPYEAYLWPISMLRPFARAADILRQIVSPAKENRARGDKKSLLVLAGEVDAIVRTTVCKKLATTFEVASVQELGNDTTHTGVQYTEVAGLGHHLQNDVGWEDGAQKLLEWYQQL